LANSIDFGGGSKIDIYNHVMQWDGDILPNVNSTNSLTGYNLGSSTFRWNNIYARNTTIQTSDERLKTNITDISYGLNEVLKLKPVNFQWKNQTNEIEIYHGFLAQDLKKIFSNSIVVGDPEKDTLGVRYAEIIPILTKAIQEQQILIENQNREIEIIRAKLPNDGNLSEKVSNTVLNKLPILFQNNPNPFDQKTNIDYFIPEGTTQASIMVFDANSKIVYSSIIKNAGMGRVILEDQAISQGTYLYSLYVDGKIIDTKKMQVVKN